MSEGKKSTRRRGRNLFCMPFCWLMAPNVSMCGLLVLLILSSYQLGNSFVLRRLCSYTPGVSLQTPGEATVKRPLLRPSSSFSSFTVRVRVRVRVTTGLASSSTDIGDSSSTLSSLLSSSSSSSSSLPCCIVSSTCIDVSLSKGFNEVYKHCYNTLKDVTQDVTLNDDDNDYNDDDNDDPLIR